MIASRTIQALAAARIPESAEPSSQFSSRRKEAVSAIPRVSPLLLPWFLWYSERYVAKHFHSVRLASDGFPPQFAGEPVVLFCNHASWWDPLACSVLQQKLFSGRRAFAPIDARMLARYRMFGRLGFFGVEQGMPRGAVQFLRTAEAILATPHTALWITPQGRFADARERPPRLQSGLGHLARRTPHASFVPLAIEYAFWEEQCPEILVRFGPAVHAEKSASSAELGAQLETALMNTQNALARQAIARDPAAFQVLLQGRRGVNFIYDTWRRLRAGLWGESFNPEHSAK